MRRLRIRLRAYYAHQRAYCASRGRRMPAASFLPSPRFENQSARFWSYPCTPPPRRRTSERFQRILLQARPCTSTTLRALGGSWLGELPGAGAGDAGLRAALRRAQTGRHRPDELARGVPGVPRAANDAAGMPLRANPRPRASTPSCGHAGDVLSSAPGPILTGFGRRAAMRMGSGAMPDAIAASSQNALGRRPRVRPGFLAKALEGALNPVPRPGRVRMMGRIMAGMTAR